MVLWGPDLSGPFDPDAAARLNRQGDQVL